jgi:hypothetical protein
VIEATTRTFKFRIKAEAHGGANAYSEPIEIKAFNCDFKGPSTVVSEKKIEIFEEVDKDKPIETFDVSKMFKEFDGNCPI